MPELLNTLKWRFDVSTFRLIGRELITDRITALFELVKNCYDANATNVKIQFLDVANGLNSKIIIEDDGCGMSLDDIQNKWMVVGTASKRTEKVSAAPFNRKYVGEKGIGRFAVDKLGSKVIIRTKQAGQPQFLNVEINWQDYENLSNQIQPYLFTEIENRFWFEDAQDLDAHGTALNITGIREKWSKENIERLCKELTKIVSPFHPLNPPFDIFVKSNEFSKEFEGLQPVKSDAIDFSSHNAKIDFFVAPNDTGNSYQEVLFFDTAKGEIVIRQEMIKAFGPVKIQFYYFNEAAKRQFNAFYKDKGDADTRIDGIKIYRDGIITTPFAEAEVNAYRKRDVLGVDKRLWQNTFDQIGSREIIGIVDITQNKNPKIVDATSRQDFVQNTEYQELRDFILSQLDIFSKMKIFERDKRRTEFSASLEKTEDSVKDFQATIRQIEDTIAKKNPELKPLLNPLKEQVKTLSKEVSRGVKEQKAEIKDFQRKENIYLSLMSLQEYAAQLAHAVKTALSSIKAMVEFFKDNFPNAKYDSLFKEYSLLIYDEMEKLRVIIRYMLSYTEATQDDFQEFNIKILIENLLSNINGFRFQNDGISILLEAEKCDLTGYGKFIEEVLQQLIDNSIKALVSSTNKKIECKGYIDKDKYVILFSDNGSGIADEIKHRIFELYFSTTAEQGGGGIGLYMAQKRLEALQGTIELVEREFSPIGTTFKITLPFKNT
jgi:signal transduction histidine kinase